MVYAEIPSTTHDFLKTQAWAFQKKADNGLAKAEGGFKFTKGDSFG